MFQARITEPKIMRRSVHSLGFKPSPQSFILIYQIQKKLETFKGKKICTWFKPFGFPFPVDRVIKKTNFMEELHRRSDW